jgi:hypothetical protein
MIPMLSGCFEPGIQQGYIYAKHYYPGWISWSSSTICTGTRIYKKCHTSQSSLYHDPEYSIDISDCRRNVDSGECKWNTLWVSGDEYSRYSVGSYYGA